MRIGERILVVMTAAFVGGGIVLFGLLRTVILKGFDRLEADESRQEIRKVEAFLRDDLDHLARNAADYGSWDETFAFVDDLDPEYIAGNLGDSTLTGLRINAMVFVRPDHTVAYAKGVDLATGADAPVPSGLLTRLGEEPALTTHPGEMSWNTGVLALPEGPLLFATVPILHSNDVGPIRGSFLMARRLDDDYLARISRILELKVGIEPWRTRAAPGGLPAVEPVTPERPVVVGPIDEEHYLGRVLLRDVSGAPAYVLRIVNPREIHREGELTVRYLVAGLLGVSLVGMGAALLLMQRFVLGRMERIRLQVQALGAGDAGVRRVLLEGRDELATLAAVIDEAFVSKRRVTEDLRASREQLEERVRERTGELSGALRRVRELDAFKAEIIRGMIGGLCVFDAAGRVVLLNPAGRALFAVEGDPVGAPLAAVLGTPLAETILAEVAAGRDHAGFTDVSLAGPSGRERVISYALSRARTGAGGEAEGIVYLWDRTEERRIDQERRRLERFAAVGEVATHVAHELRNPLTAMYSTMQYLVRDLRGEAREMGGIVLENMERMEGTIRAMSRLAREGDGAVRPVDLRALVLEVVEFLGPALRERGLAARPALPFEPVRVDGDDAELRQVLLNLLTNAMQAMPGGGEIAVGLAAEPELGLAALAVADRGGGIPAGIRGRVFDPFFTSKERGTGIGLAVVERVVRRHGGTVSFADRPGGGTVFTVELPLAKEG